MMVAMLHCIRVCPMQPPCIWAKCWLHILHMPGCLACWCCKDHALLVHGALEPMLCPATACMQIMQPALSMWRRGARDWTIISAWSVSTSVPSTSRNHMLVLYLAVNGRAGHACFTISGQHSFPFGSKRPCITGAICTFIVRTRRSVLMWLPSSRYLSIDPTIANASSNSMGAILSTQYRQAELYALSWCSQQPVPQTLF